MKRTKSLIAILATLCMVVGLTLMTAMPIYAADWDGQTKTQPTDGEGTEAAPYQITSGAHLAWVAQEVNDGLEGVDLTGAHFKLMYDINLGGYDNDGTPVNAWTAIGTSSNPFAGTFDGGDNLISGLYINSPTADNQSLFGYVGEGGTVKNVTVSGSVTGITNVGGVVGWNYGSVTNCHSEVNVTGKYTIGGVVGANNGSIFGCTSTTKIIGAGTGVPAGAYIGGIVGENYGVVINCSSSATVSGIDQVGGVAGLNSGGTVINSHNSGNITADSNAGGVVGQNSSSTVTNSYNTGAVSGEDAGGVVSNNTSDSIVTNCYWQTGKGVTNGVGSNGGTATNIGSFDNFNAAITLTDETINPNDIPHTNLLTALNAGAGVYNQTLTDFTGRAYMWVQESSSNPTLTADEVTGDTNYDYEVDVTDLNKITTSSLYNSTLTNGATSPLDLNRDGKINFADLAMARNSKFFGK